MSNIIGQKKRTKSKEEIVQEKTIEKLQNAYNGLIEQREEPRKLMNLRYNTMRDIVANNVPPDQWEQAAEKILKWIREPYENRLKTEKAEKK